MVYEEKNDGQQINAEHSFLDDGMECFSKRLLEALGGEKPRAFAQRSDFSEGAVRSYLSGDTYPALDRLALLAQSLGVDAKWLAFGAGDQSISGDEGSDEFVHVTQMAGRNGVINRSHAFRADWLKEQGLEPSRLSVTETREDSMEPTVQPGDLLLCETYMHRTETNIVIGLAPGELPPQDGIYFIRRGDKGPTSLRRLRLDMAGGFIISADADSSVQLHANNDVLAGISILARVVSLQRLV